MNLIDTQASDLAGRGAPGNTGLERIQTINDLSESQVSAIRQIPPHVQARPKAI